MLAQGDDVLRGQCSRGCAEEEQKGEMKMDSREKTQKRKPRRTAGGRGRRDGERVVIRRRRGMRLPFARARVKLLPALV